MKKYIVSIIILFVVLLFIGAPVRYVYAPVKYRTLVKKYAARYHLDWLLVMSIIYHESRFRRRAVSPKGARGLMQLMPGTAAEVARKLGWNDFSLDSLFKPKINIDLGCYYFASMLQDFNGDPRLALAAYNAGKGSVYQWYNKVKVKDGLSYPSQSKGKIKYSDIAEHLYPETKRYVHRVYGTYRLLKTMNNIWKL